MRSQLTTWLTWLGAAAALTIAALNLFHFEYRQRAQPGTARTPPAKPPSSPEAATANLGNAQKPKPELSPPAEIQANQQVAAQAATVRIKNGALEMTGSGAIVATRGPFLYLLTAQHVIEDGKQ